MRTDPPDRPASARVEHLHIKPCTPGERGIPKQPVASIMVDAAGVEGDHNRFRHERRRDDPDQAVLVLPAEILVALGAEGWPVEPGHLGENLTVAGLANDAVAVGQRYRVGGELLLEISRVCDPCVNLAALPYVGRARVKDFMRATLGRRGWYARVLAPASVHVGDPFQRADG